MPVQTIRATKRSVVGILLALCYSSSPAQEPARRVAVTIDDLPTVNIVGSTENARNEVTQRLLASLGSRKIPAIGFVNESKLYEAGVLVPERLDLLGEWLNAGFELGNHSFSHPDLHRVSAEEFTDDIIRGETNLRLLLASYDRTPEYFRHPFLHTGRSLEIKRDVEDFLASNGYRVAPVTIDNSEWIFARAYVIARRQGDTELAESIGQDYVEYMLQMFAYYEDQSKQLFNRDISQVLLIHANELNADWLGALVDRLIDIGYRFVSLDAALADPAYESDDAYIGPGGITWIHRWAITRGVDPEMFRGEPTTPDYVLQLTELPEHGY